MALSLLFTYVSSTDLFLLIYLFSCFIFTRDGASLKGECYLLDGFFGASATDYHQCDYCRLYAFLFWSIYEGHFEKCAEHKH